MNENDFGPLYGLLSDSRVMEYIEPPFTKEKTSRFLADAGLCEPPLVFAIEKDNEFIGYVIFHGYDEKSIEIGWVLKVECWGKGYASKLTETLIEKGLSLDKQLIIECVPEQEVTKHIAKKFGFMHEGLKDGLEVFRLVRADTGSETFQE